MTRPAAAGDWIVRGILPVISRVRLAEHGDGWHGHLDMWGEEVPVVATWDGAVLRLETTAETTFPLSIAGDLAGDELRMRFANVGVEFDLRADRADPAALEAHLAARPVAIEPPPRAVLPPDGLAPRPPMGWNSWFGLRLRIDDASIREVATALVDTGLRDAGYATVTLDDGWQGGRGVDGVILPKPGFPDMAGLGRHLHDLGLGFGIYSSPGPATCADYTGSLGHEEQDARTFARWGVDLLKYDWCSAAALYRTEDEMQRVLQRMGAALRESGRDIVFSLCQYGAFDVPRWGASVGGHLWRVGYDVEDRWESIVEIGFAEPSGPAGGWNDLDMLQIGLGGLSADEYRTQLTIWAMRSAPLILSAHPRDLSAEELAILTDPHVIAVDQDALAAQPTRLRSDGADVWVKPLERGAAVAVINRGDAPLDAAVRWDELGIAAPGRMRDVWGARDSAAGEGWSGVLPAHASALLVLRPAT